MRRPESSLSCPFAATWRLGESKPCAAFTPAPSALLAGRFRALYASGMDAPKNRFQVSLRTVLEIVAVVAIVFALLFQRGENKNGRYQLTVDNVGGSAIYMTDTATGQIWTATSGGWTKWTPLPP